MNSYTEAKERICRSLLSRIKFVDDKLSDNLDTDDVELLREYYLRQTYLLRRLELVLTTQNY